MVIRLTVHRVAALLAALAIFSPTDGARSDEAPFTTTLRNGFKVILREVHANPVVSVVVCVKVGSRDETEVNNGVSHLLEHLLFDGTGARGRREIADRARDLGGYLNAFTREDLTAYILLIPSEHLEEGLAIQSDMLFGSILPPEELDKERKVVIEEINKDEDSVPYQVEVFHQAQLYRGSPYALPVLGQRNVVATLPREEILGYYRAHYIPNNMIALVTGDFHSDSLLPLLQRYYGDVPPRPLPVLERAVTEPPDGALRWDRELETAASYVTISFWGPAPRDPDFYPFGLLADLLTAEEGSWLKGALLSGPDPLATEVHSECILRDGFTVLTVQAVTPPGREDQALARCLEEFRGISRKGPSREEVRRALVTLTTQDAYLEERPHYYGMMKAPALTLAGFDFLAHYFEEMGKVTPEEISRVAGEYLRDRYVATVVRPRAAQPERPAPRSAEEERRVVLPNGLTLLVRSNTDSRVFALVVLAKDRPAWEPEGKGGLADLLSRLLLKGTKRRPADLLSRELAAIGARVMVVDDPAIPYDDVYTSPLYSFLRLETIEEFAGRGIELAADIIRHPAFPREAVEAARQELRVLVAREGESTSKSARSLFFATLFKGHPLGRPLLGTDQEVASLTREDLVELHGRLYSPENLIVSAVGSLPADEMVERLTRAFGDMASGDGSPNLLPLSVELTAPIVAERTMGKEQAYLYWGYPLPGATHPDVPALRLLTALLSTRCGQILREERGLAYSVSASSSFFRDVGWIAVAMGTGRANYEVAREGIREEIRRLREEPVSAGELAAALDKCWGDLLMSRLSRINQAFYMAVNEYSGAGYDYDRTVLDLLKGVSPADIQRVARAYLDPDRYVLAAIR